MRIFGKSTPGAPGVRMFGQSRSITGKRSVNRLIKRDESRGITMPEANSLVKGFVNATLTTALAGANNDLKFTAKEQGVDGNLITVAYVDPGGATATLGVVVTGNAIVVNLGRAASAINTTGALLKAAIEGSAPAAALVTVEHAAGNSGAGLVTALTATALTGGYTPIPVAAGGGLGGPTAGSGTRVKANHGSPGAGKRQIKTPSAGNLKRR